MHCTHSRHTAKGETLLISLLVLGFLTLGFVLVGIQSIIDEAQVSVVGENKAIASAAATACMEHALNGLALDVGYAGNETRIVGAQSCTIRPIVSGGTYTLETFSQVKDQWTRYRVILTSRAPVAISSWTEVASF